MRDYKFLLQKHISESILNYRTEKDLSQEKVSKILRISSRSYIDQEHGKYGYSALSLMFYLSVLKDEEIVDFVRSFIQAVDDEERKLRFEHPLVYYHINEAELMNKSTLKEERVAK